MTGALFSALTTQTTELIERIRQSVVLVRSADGHGAGVIWDRQGWIVTNHHVAPRDHAQVELNDGRCLEARILARDRDNDLALLRVAAPNLSAAPVGDSRALQVGGLVLAVGHPWGVPGTATLGIISAVGAAMGGGRTRREVLQADVALAPGNSGGPLANAAGEVVGIACMVMSPGIALAIPSHVVQRFIQAVYSRAYRWAV